MENDYLKGLDPVTFAVLKNSFISLVDRMAEHILRTTYSFVIFNRDFSCALNDASGDTIMQGTQDVAVHVGTLHYTAKAVLEYFKDELYPGDVIAINDPYAGGTHFPDVRIMRPVFYNGELIAITQTNGHWADVGGPVPGSFNVNAKEYYAEGFRITPVKLWEKGKFRRDVAELIANNMRVPEERIGDIHAQAAATAVGEKYLLQLIQKYGIKTVLTAFEAVKDYSELLLRKKIKNILEKYEERTWNAYDYIDYDPSGDYDKPVKINVTMTINDKYDVLYDLSGSDPYVNSFLNSAFGSAYSGLVAGTKLFFPEVPLNSGIYRVIKANLPKNSVVNAPWPVPVTGFASGAYEKIINSVIYIWSQIIPERAMACSYNLEYLLVGGWDLREENSVKQFMWYDWMVGGLGGRNGIDGMNASAPLFGFGLSIQSLEGQERLNPVLTTKHELITDSGGPGKYRGGCGVEKGGVILKSKNVIMSYMADRARIVPWGIFGGLPSIPIGVRLKRAYSDNEEYLGVYFSNIELSEGDSFIRPSAGGGGLGDPLDRDPKLVLEDVIDGYVSIERAKKDYGVIIIPKDPELGLYEIDEDATKKEREYIRKNRLSWLKEDPYIVYEKWKKGEIDTLDAIRRYGVIIDLKTGQLLYNTTKIYRELLLDRAAKYWK